MTSSRSTTQSAEMDANVATLLPIDPADVAALRERLATAALGRDLLDIAYRTVDSPVGTLLLAATDAGLVRVAYEREGFEHVLHTLAQVVSPRILRAPRRLDAAATEVDEYFAGTRRRFDLPLDFALSSGFRRLVQRGLPQIDYGHTRSYRDIAALVGSPKAARAVGTACATNPLPIVLPCHRVVRTDGSLGGYIGGLDAKRTLLALEHAG